MLSDKERRMKTAATSARAIPATKVNGTEVYNTAGEHLGEIDDILIDKLSGKATTAVMSFGGFLGIGEKFHPLPWQQLKYDTDKDGYVVAMTKDQLKDAPHFARDEITRGDTVWGEQVYGYYNEPPYWV
jgi:sporulation protein YlmC with PRC-barrel domain